MVITSKQMQACALLCTPSLVLGGTYLRTLLGTDYLMVNPASFATSYIAITTIFKFRDSH
jgi:hypothetical protein